MYLALVLIVGFSSSYATQDQCSLSGKTCNSRGGGGGVKIKTKSQFVVGESHEMKLI